MKLLKEREVKIEEVIEILERGGVIVYPTETLYGIGVKYDNREGLRKIYELKRRPKDRTIPLIVKREHLPLVSSEVPPLAQKLIEKYWPGPLTILLPALKGLPEEIVRDQKVAVRMPGASFALRLIIESPFPITATSANISDLPASSDFDRVLYYFKDSDIDLMIDGGKLGGVPSTIVDATSEPIRVLRQGALKLDLSSY